MGNLHECANRGSLGPRMGGVASVAGNIAIQLRKRGHHVWFLHPGESESLRVKTTSWNFPGYELNLRNPIVCEHPVNSVDDPHVADITHRHRETQAMYTNRFTPTQVKYDL